MKKNALILITSVLIAAVTLGGCGKKLSTTGGKIDYSLADAEYPLDTEETLTWWTALTSDVVASSGTLNDTEFAKGLIERTGVKIDFIHPALGQETEQFNLLLASRELPDIIESQWKNYSGGVQNALDENIIIPLNDLIDKLSPNMKKILEENPEYKKNATSANGSIYAYPFLMDDEILATYYGPMVRGDMLEKCGLDVPETIDDWDKMLRAFKANGIEVPLVLDLSTKRMKEVSPFVGAYGISGGFFVEDQTVKYGPYEPAFADFVKQLRDWYNDGLFDSNFTDTDSKRITAIMAGGRGGATFGGAGGNFGKWIPALREINPNAYFTPTKYPVLNRGEKPKFGQKKDMAAPSTQIAISGNCKNPALAAKVLDYGYGEEGHLYYNFGIEGVSYVMQDGIPTYTDIIMNPEKNGIISVTQAMSKYVRSYSSGPFSQDVNYIYQYYGYDEQKKALDLWNDTDAMKYKFPAVTYTNEESSDYIRLMTDIETYQEEMLYKAITSTISWEEFMGLRDELKKRGIEDILKIQQAAYDRYMQN